MKKKAARPSLLIKLLRDLKQGWKSFLAILIICSLAVVLYMGLDATWRSVDADLDLQFGRSNMADLWVRGEMSDRTLRDAAAIPGVSEAQRRVSANFEAPALAENPTITLVSGEGESTVCIPLLREGRLPVRRGEGMLGERFAQAHGLKPGDSISLSLGDRKLELLITGLGLMPEYVVSSQGDELSPSALKAGFAYVSRDTLDFLPYSEIALTLSPQAEEGAVRSALQELTDGTQTVVIGREDIFGIKMAMEQAQQIRAMGAIFPLIFFVIAALITWTTMNRLVESQRLQIGGLFALGYTRPELLFHYAGYGMLIAVLGLVIGLVGARWALAPIIMHFLTFSYALPDAVPRLSFPVSLAVGAALTAMTGGASMLSARAALSQVPAALMRPKPPGRGKRILLENIKWLWRRIPFSEKMILRNMFRSPARLFMGLAGAIGCSALILTGFGLRDSVDYVLVNHYTRTMHYDMRVSFSKDAAPGYGRAVALRAGADEYEEQMITAAQVHTPGGWRVKQLYVLDDEHDMIRLSDETGARLTLPAQGIALTSKAAEDFGLEIGGTLLLRNPGGRTVGAKVEQIVDLQLNQGVYMTRTAWQQLGLSPFMPTHTLLRGGSLQPGAVIEDMDGVSTARTLKQERDSGTATLQIMNVIVVLLVLFSGALELVVFYNLGQLNFSERIRELATLKVLGFTRGEMKKLVLRENIVITAMGLPLGLLLGPPLLQLLLTYGLPNTIQFVSFIAPASWLYTVGTTLIFALLVNSILGAKFKSVNMVEALKSVE